MRPTANLLLLYHCLTTCSCVAVIWRFFWIITWNYKHYSFLCLVLFPLQDNLSAIDILSACNLVNYFGKMVLGGSGVGQITLCPILIKKVGILGSKNSINNNQLTNTWYFRVQLRWPCMALETSEMNDLIECFRYSRDFIALILENDL